MPRTYTFSILDGKGGMCVSFENEICKSRTHQETLEIKYKYMHFIQCAHPYAIDKIDILQNEQEENKTLHA